MMNYEFEGKTAEEAIENASRQLDVPVEELDVDIIEPGSAGIFGLVGTKKAIIRVNISIDEDEDEEIDKEVDKEVDREDNTDNQEILDKSKEILEEILRLIPVETTVFAKQIDNNSKIALNIEGDASGLLIGRKGKTLDAIQYLVNKIVNKLSEKKVRIIVDSENYRQRRIESLTQLANKLGDKAKKIKKSVTTNPLNPHDRRIVHLTLKQDKGLNTRSRGNGLLKKVIIFPKK